MLLLLWWMLCACVTMHSRTLAVDMRTSWLLCMVICPKFDPNNTSHVVLSGRPCLTKQPCGSFCRSSREKNVNIKSKHSQKNFNGLRLLICVKMEEIVASVADLKFEIEAQMYNQVGVQPLPFPGMDKSGAAVCEYFMRNMCNRGPLCPFRHTKGEKTVVCKHWLRGLCKKGDQCEFLHEYDMTKMPECYFYSKFGECSNKECQYLHIDPESKIKDCPWYDRGFCKHGPSCRHRHVRRVLCLNYMCGFCPEGPKCKHMHPRFELPVKDEGGEKKSMNIVCHYCNQPGHKASGCPSNPHKENFKNFSNQSNISIVPVTTNTHIETERPMMRRPLESVTCYKCGDKGHYANKCPKSRSEVIGL